MRGVRSSCSSVSGRRVKTRQRESSAEMISKEGFSVVAPMRRMDAALDVGQESVLLGFVEAVDFVDEEDGARAEGRGFFGVDHDLLDFFDAGEDGGEFDEAGAGLFGDDFGEGGLADAGRAPEDDRGGIVALDQHAERLAGPEEMLLAGELVEGAGAHALGERSGGRVPRGLEVGRGSEETHAFFCTRCAIYAPVVVAAGRFY